MNKPNPRHGEHVQREKPPGAKADGSTAITAARSDASAASGGGDVPPADPTTAQKYWIVILFWAVGFGLMLVYEIIALIWRT